MKEREREKERPRDRVDERDECVYVSSVSKCFSFRKRRKSIRMGMRTRKLHMFSSPIYLAFISLHLCTQFEKQSMFHFVCFFFCLFHSLTVVSLIFLCCSMYIEYFTGREKFTRRVALVLGIWPQIRSE